MRLALVGGGIILLLSGDFLRFAVRRNIRDIIVLIVLNTTTPKQDLFCNISK